MVPFIIIYFAPF